MDEEAKIKRRKFRAAKNYLNFIQWTVKALLIPLGGTTLAAANLTYICLRDNLQELLPYSIIMTLLGFIGIIVAIYLGFNVEFKDLLRSETFNDDAPHRMKVDEKSEASALDKESVKPCIQDRFRSNISRARDIFAYFPILCLTILILIIITLPEILTLTIGRKTIIPILSEISLEGRFAILFSFSVALFTSIQYRSERKRNKINDLRNELEKAYGPLYSLFNPNFWDYYGRITNEGKPTIINNINITKNEKEKLNFILSNYPFMFKPEIFTYWREHLQYQAMPDDSDERMFSIDEEFINMVYDEYHQRIEEYNNLLGKKSARAQFKR